MIQASYNKYQIIFDGRLRASGSLLSRHCKTTTAPKAIQSQDNNLLESSIIQPWLGMNNQLTCFAENTPEAATLSRFNIKILLKIQKMSMQSRLWQLKEQFTILNKSILIKMSLSTFIKIHLLNSSMFIRNCLIEPNRSKIF